MKLTDTEWQIMTLLWKQHPATAREMANRLPKEVKWAYTTIKTLLSRLVDKGAVGEKKRGNVSIYKPLISQDDARKSAIRSLIDKAFGGMVAPMMHFLAEETGINEKKRKQLLNLLDDLEQKEDD